jgi:hypothetical protein
MRLGAGMAGVGRKGGESLSMGMPILGITRKFWLHMLHSGGHWSARELRDLLCPHDYDAHAAEQLLRNLLQSGAVKRFRSAERKNGVAYGVTRDCVIPAGVNLKDVLSATLHKLD